MTTDKALRDHVVRLLDGRGAHMSYDEAIAAFPMDKINLKPPNIPYTFWHLLEHLRITQWDILEYVRNPQHESPNWPEGYWPPREQQADETKWADTVRQFRADLQAMKSIVSDPATDLLTPIPHGYGGHTVLREALVLADHNAYHVGEFGILRGVLDLWGK
jgi:hypothetical protein